MIELFKIVKCIYDQARSQGGLGGLGPPPNRSAPEICTVIKQLPLTGPVVYLVLYLTVLTKF